MMTVHQAIEISIRENRSVDVEADLGDIYSLADLDDTVDLDDGRVLAWGADWSVYVTPR